MAYGTSVTTANRKMIVRPAMRMLSAISFGVFWRSAPSTSAIILSRKVSPGLDVIRILIRSERTRVPPVTALRSPPDSRMTGALSPVITDSSTVATPSMTSPSPGIVSPAMQTTTSPARSFDDDTCSSRPPSTTRFAIVSLLVLRSVSACAFPRASAIASAKVANSTVNQSHTSICSSKPIAPVPVTTSRTRKRSTSAAPISTTKMTGFFISVTGFSFNTESFNARRRISGSNSGRARTSFFGIRVSSTGTGVTGAGGAAGTAVEEAISQLHIGNGTIASENRKFATSSSRKAALGKYGVK